MLCMVAGGTADQPEKSSRRSWESDGKVKGGAVVSEAKGFACEKKLSRCWASMSLSSEWPPLSKSCEGVWKKSAEKVSGCGQRGL